MQKKIRIMLPVATALMIMGAHADLVLSNTQTNAGRQQLQREIRPGLWHATPITTDGFDYSLTSIIAEIVELNPAGTTPFMEIWSVDQDFATPGTTIAKLTISGYQPTLKTFTGNVTLSANTSYFIVTGVDDGGGQWYEMNNFSDPLGPDFNVDNGSWTLETLFSGSSFKTAFSSSSQGSSWQSNVLNGPLRMEIEAVVIPESSVISLIGLGGLTLLSARRIKALRKAQTET